MYNFCRDNFLFTVALIIHSFSLVLYYHSHTNIILVLRIIGIVNFPSFHGTSMCITCPSFCTCSFLKPHNYQCICRSCGVHLFLDTSPVLAVLWPPLSPRVPWYQFPLMQHLTVAGAPTLLYHRFPSEYLLLSIGDTVGCPSSYTVLVSTLVQVSLWFPPYFDLCLIIVCILCYFQCFPLQSMIFPCWPLRPGFFGHQMLPFQFPFVPWIIHQ